MTRVRLPPAPSSRHGRVVLVATMRNEGPFILEWVAYHRAIGFTDLVVCTNDCVDASPALLDHLQGMGLVTHLRTRVPDGGKPQLAAYAQAEALPLIGEAAWAMVLDADEFLNVHVGVGHVGDLIDAVPHASAILVNWRLFGDAGRETWSPGFVTERFTRAARRDDAVNLSFKTLFRGIDAYQCKLMPHQPRYPARNRLHELRYVDGGGDTLPSHFFDESRDTFLQSDPGSVSWTLAQVNHYNTRSREDYLVKHRRGGGLNIDWDREESWAIFNKNDESDVSIVGRLPVVRDAVEALLRDAGIEASHRRCCDLYRRHVAELKTRLPSQARTR